MLHNRNRSGLLRSRMWQLSPQSLVLLTLWAICACAIFFSSLFGIWQNWAILFLLGSTVSLLALWFSLQLDIARFYLPGLPGDEWTFQSVSGFVAGVIVGVVVGFSGGMATISWMSSSGNYGRSEFLWVAAGAGLMVGFATLGWRQAKVLDPYVVGAWWVGAMAIAWVPALFAWLGYEALVEGMAVNIYPGAHDVVRLLAAEVALLCPSLAMFGTVVRQGETIPSTDATLQPGKRPVGIIASLFVPPLIVAIAYGALMLGQALRVERAWMAKDGPAGYLSVGMDGDVKTSPSPDEKWDPKLKLQDYSPDGSMRVGVEGPRIVISTTNSDIGPPRAPTIIRTIEVFPGLSQEDYYSDEVVNVVRFSPDGTMVAAGTGQVWEIDSAMSRSEDHAVHIWSVHDHELQYTLSDPVYTVRALAWSPDGRYLAAAGGLETINPFYGDNVVRVWRLDTAQSVERASPSLELTLVGHTASVEAVAWSSNSNRLVSRDLSGRVVVWKIP
jgi:hypothetical protein